MPGAGVVAWPQQLQGGCVELLGDTTHGSTNFSSQVVGRKPGFRQPQLFAPLAQDPSTNDQSYLLGETSTSLETHLQNPVQGLGGGGGGCSVGGAHTQIGGLQWLGGST